MNRDEIWQQLKDEKETVYGERMMDVFLSITSDLNIKHLEEALDSDLGHKINDDTIISKIHRGLIGGIVNNSDLLDKIISKKKDMGGKLITTILNLYDPEEMKKVSERININKMTIDDIHTLFWLKTATPQDIQENSIEILHEMFGEKLKQFNVKQIFSLIKQLITVRPQWRLSRIDDTDKLIDILGGWKSLVEKMMLEQDSLARNGQLNTYENRDLQAHIKNTPLGKHFAEKIIEYGKDMNLPFVDAETMAGSFHKDYR